MLSPKAQAVVLALIAFFTFANSLGGEFVYDDNRQIVMNPLVHQRQLYGKALTSDVWAFKGDGTVSASNYYRPTFVLWLIVNFVLFGANPFGWHLANVLIHVAASLLSWVLLRRLGMSSGLSFVLAVLFAVHPVHVENVAWISGSPDVLLSLFFISSLLVLHCHQKNDRWSYITSLLLYAFALGTKETAMLFFPIYYFFLIFQTEQPAGNQGAPRKVFPFAVLAAVFFIIRWLVLGGVTHTVDDAPTFTQSLLSVPSVFLFYLRQVIFPVFLAENYPLRPETALTLYFLLSSIAFLAVLVLMWWVCRGNKLRQFGAALFFLPLLPALYIGAFPSDQVVHDRYLYLPLLGFLIVAGSTIAELAVSNSNVRQTFAIAVGIIAILLVGQTVLYDRVWSSDFSLWEYNVRADPNSASSFANYASELSDKGRYSDAIAAYDRALSIKELPLALMGRARNLIALGRYSEAIDDSRKVIELPNEEANAYTLYQAYETAAIAYSSDNRFAEAESSIRNARERLPIYRAALTDKLAIILYNQGKKDEALRELNSVRDQARRELLPASKAVFLRLGMLEAELGNTAESKRDLHEFLQLSATFTDSESVNLRKQATAALARMR